MQTDEERLLRLLADRRNRAILTVLNDEARELPIADLAERLVGEDEPVVGPDEYERELDSALVSLHHNRLPKLSEAGLVEYDPDENVVGYGDYSTVDPEWLNVEMLEELFGRVRSRNETNGDDVGILEGRADILEYGRRLADEARDELFLIFLSADMLEEECIRRLRDALDRGVNVTLGTPDPEVREIVRERLPEVELWEPQLDWTNTPSSYPRVGRFVLADRDKVMLGLLTDPDGDCSTAERAVVGRGERNPVVVVVRDLLGPRIDHLDYQSETFSNELPFEP